VLQRKKMYIYEIDEHTERFKSQKLSNDH